MSRLDLVTFRFSVECRCAIGIVANTFDAKVRKNSQMFWAFSCSQPFQHQVWCLALPVLSAAGAARQRVTVGVRAVLLLRGHWRAYAPTGGQWTTEGWEKRCWFLRRGSCVQSRTLTPLSKASQIAGKQNWKRLSPVALPGHPSQRDLQGLVLSWLRLSVLLWWKRSGLNLCITSGLVRCSLIAQGAQWIIVGAVPLLHLVLKRDPNHPLLGERFLILAVVPPVVILDHVSIPQGRGVHNIGVKESGDPALGTVVV